MRYIVLISFCAVLSACGVKPGDVDPPPGTGEVTFPQTYPDVETDPIPRDPVPTQMRRP